MKKDDRFNLKLAQSPGQVDRINKEFYGKFNYPWPPLAFRGFTDTQFAVTMLNQDIGDWTHRVIPGNPEIWVAGCGTNQAVFTALRFPGSRVLGTDLSTRSLEIAKKYAQQVGLENLELEEKSINHVTYKDKFDYIICTGVIHHNAVPGGSLKKLATALKPGGVIELMVHNYYHTFLANAYQKAIRELCGDGTSINLEVEMAATKKLIAEFSENNLMTDFLKRFKFLRKFKNVHDIIIGDVLLQPVLHSYTIETFQLLISGANLECLLPCINPLDKEENCSNWNLTLTDPELAARYDSLPDGKRWYIANLLMGEKSPLIWFYLQKKDSPNLGKSEKQVCAQFLETRFEKTSTKVKEFTRKKGQYVLNSKTKSFPLPAEPPDEMAGAVFNQVSPNRSIEDIFHHLNLAITFHNVNHVRINLATTAYPYIKAISTPSEPADINFDIVKKMGTGI